MQIFRGSIRNFSTFIQKNLTRLKFKKNPKTKTPDWEHSFAESVKLHCRKKKKGLLPKCLVVFIQNKSRTQSCFSSTSQEKHSQWWRSLQAVWGWEQDQSYTPRWACPGLSRELLWRSTTAVKCRAEPISVGCPVLINPNLTSGSLLQV